MWDRPLLKTRRPSPLSDSWAPHFPATVVKCAELAVGSEWKMVAAGCWSVLKSAQSEFGRARSKHGLKSQNKTALMKTKKSELSEFGSARQLGLNWKMELFNIKFIIWKCSIFPAADRWEKSRRQAVDVSGGSFCSFSKTAFSWTAEELCGFYKTWTKTSRGTWRKADSYWFMWEKNGCHVYQPWLGM